MITYHVSVPAPETHRADVVVDFETTATETIVRLPVWTPGSYLVREFSRYLGELRAYSTDGTELELTKLEKGTWRLRCDTGSHVQLRYNAWCHELTVRTPHIDATHAFFTGTNLLVYVDGRLHEPARLRIETLASWHTFCALPGAGDYFEAPDYDTLADAPVELGPHPVLNFEALGVPHRIILWGSERVRINDEKLIRDFRKIVETNAAIFGGLPYSNYDFILHITAEGRGGLEHLNSTVLATPWRYFDTEDGYRDLLGLTAHEHFHVWNVKRIKPNTLVPFQYERENYTRALWVSEGFTSYFDDLVCMRGGLFTHEQFLETIRDRVQRLSEVPGRLVQSVEAASLDAWIRLYRPDEDSPYRTVSYYLKGSVVALALDLEIRAKTRGEFCLDDVMRLLWTHFRETGAGFDEAGVAALVQQATTLDLHERIQHYTETTAEIELEALFASHGLVLANDTSQPPHFGWDGHAGAHDVVVRHVEPGSPAEAAGIAPGDVLAAIDYRRVTPDSIKAITARAVIGETFVVHHFRRGALLTSNVVPAEHTKKKYSLRFDENADPDAIALRQKWLLDITTGA